MNLLIVLQFVDNIHTDTISCHTNFIPLWFHYDIIIDLFGIMFQNFYSSPFPFLFGSTLLCCDVFCDYSHVRFNAFVGNYAVDSRRITRGVRNRRWVRSGADGGRGGFDRLECVAQIRSYIGFYLSFTNCLRFQRRIITNTLGRAQCKWFGHRTLHHLNI